MVCASKKSAYQSPTRPRIAGRLRSNGAERKCSSIPCDPASISAKRAGPIAIIVDRPIADSME